MITIQFVSYAEMVGLSQAKRLRKIISLVKEEKIVLMEGRLKSPDDAELIKEAMQEIDEKFKGIEIAEVNPEHSEDAPFFAKLRVNFVNILIGDRAGMTIIGPATVIKEIKKDPNKIQLFAIDANNKKKRR